MNKTLKLFYKFLEANGALIAWEQAYLDYQATQDEPKSRAEFFHKQFTVPYDSHGLGFIISAFIWHETPQGNDYWSDLNSKWRNDIDRLGQSHPY